MEDAFKIDAPGLPKSPPGDPWGGVRIVCKIKMHDSIGICFVLVGVYNFAPNGDSQRSLERIGRNHGA